MRAFNKLLQPLQRKLRQVVSRGIVKLVDTETLFSELQVVGLDGEVMDNVELFEQYGITSHPQENSEGVLLSLNGRRSHSIVICVGKRQFRMKGLKQGEVALYDDQGQQVYLKRDGILIKSTLVTVDAPKAVFTGNVEVAGNTDIGGNTTIAAAMSAATASVSGATGVGSLSVAGAAYQDHQHTNTEPGTGKSGGVA